MQCSHSGSVMPGVEDCVVPESNFKGCYVENLDLRRPVTGLLPCLG